MITLCIFVENGYDRIYIFRYGFGRKFIQREKWSKFYSERKRDIRGVCYETIRSQPDKFHSYTGMSVSTFDFILMKIELRLRLNDTNFLCTISPAEKLIVREHLSYSIFVLK